MTSFSFLGQRARFLDHFAKRGFLHQATHQEGLQHLMEEGPVTAYIGFDCTASSLHVGNLMGIMMLRLLQHHGHKPIILLGGGTTQVGDPSGKDESRKLLDKAAIEANKAGILAVLKQFIQFGTGADEAVLVDNAEWLESLHYIDFLRDYGRHFSVNRMLTYDSVKMRLEREQNLTFLEFNYMLLQSYDFVELNRRYGCRLQLGGSDQWGNITSGIELQRRLGGEELFGLTCPLITTAQGAKMGKTAQGAVWLAENHLPIFDYWQFWRNSDDRDVMRFMRYFTDLSLDEIAAFESNSQLSINELKKQLATHATALCHGHEKAEQAAKTAEQLFEQGSLGSANMPVVTVSWAELEAGVPAFQLVQLAGLSQSGGEARRLIRGRGVKWNGEIIADEQQLIRLIDQNSLEGGVLSAGKKHFVRVMGKE